MAGRGAPGLQIDTRGPYSHVFYPVSTSVTRIFPSLFTILPLYSFVSFIEKDEHVISVSNLTSEFNINDFLLI